METMQVGDLKARFSEVIERVRRGEEIVISFGRKRENVAALIPYSAYRRKNRIKLGLLKGRAEAAFADDFKMSPEELLGK
jgi:prevent-host-death family protein